jgi:hypothetical protein
MRKKALFGKVESVQTEPGDSCKCNFSDPQFIVNNSDYYYLIDESYSVSYLSFDKLKKALKGIELGVHVEDSDEYNRLKNFCAKSVLENFYRGEESVYLHTCYSEWTCGEPGDRTYIRIDELKHLKGKYVIFFLG